jgi:hypothetical protein
MKGNDKIKGGLSDNSTIQDIADKHKVSVDRVKSELKDGVKVEMEHASDKSIAEEISMDHLFEDIDYYIKLAKMEGEKEKINESAKRMRILSGLSEGAEKKTLKTINEGASKKPLIKEGFESFVDDSGDKIYLLPYQANSVDELVKTAIFYGDDALYSFLNGELASNEGVKLKNGNIFWGADIIDALRADNTPRQSIAENKEESENDFEVHKFKQNTIEEGESDVELYTLNENTIIVLDFLDDVEEK